MDISVLYHSCHGNCCTTPVATDSSCRHSHFLCIRFLETLQINFSHDNYSERFHDLVPIGFQKMAKPDVRDAFVCPYNRRVNGMIFWRYNWKGFSEIFEIVCSFDTSLVFILKYKWYKKLMTFYLLTKPTKINVAKSINT
jgi:hypothetical protein